jgi:hypothetical protein
MTETLLPRQNSSFASAIPHSKIFVSFSIVHLTLFVFYIFKFEVRDKRTNGTVSGKMGRTKYWIGGGQWKKPCWDALTAVNGKCRLTRSGSLLRIKFAHWFFICN